MIGKLWAVCERKPLGSGDRKVAVFRYVTVGETDAEAIATAQSEHAHSGSETRSKWWAYEVPGGSFGIGCYLDDATDADRATRAEYALAERKALSESRKRQKAARR
jgi:hypothetical protein